MVSTNYNPKVANDHVRSRHVNSLSVISRLATCHGAVLHGLNDLARHEGSPLAINASVLQLSSPVNVGVCNSSGRVVWLIKKASIQPHHHTPPY